MVSAEAAARERVTSVLREEADEISDRWVQLQLAQPSLNGEVSEAELGEEADALVGALLSGLDLGLPVERVVSSHEEMHRTVSEISMRRARRGVSPTATSLAVLSLKEALLEAVQRRTREGRTSSAARC